MPKNVEAPLSRYLIKSSVHMPINVIILLLRYLIKSKVHMPMNDTAILSHFVIIKVHMPMNVTVFLIYLFKSMVLKPMYDSPVLKRYLIQCKVHMPMNVIVFLPIYLISDIMNILQILICIFLCRCSLHTSRAPRFHTWGHRNPSDNNLPYGTRSLGSLGQHRSAQWREEDSLDQLHLNNHVRIRMGKSVIKYFSKIYSLDQEIQLEEQHHDHLDHAALLQAVDPEPVLALAAPLYAAEEVPVQHVLVTAHTNSAHAEQLHAAADNHKLPAPALPLAVPVPVAAEGLALPAPDTVAHGPDRITPVPTKSTHSAHLYVSEDQDFYLEINSGYDLHLDQRNEGSHSSHSPDLDLLDSD